MKTFGEWIKFLKDLDHGETINSSLVYSYLIFFDVKAKLGRGLTGFPKNYWDSYFKRIKSYRYTLINIEEIEFSSHNELNRVKINSYKNKFKDSGFFPPIILNAQNPPQIVDGNHRFKAAKEINLKEIGSFKPFEFCN